MNHFPMKMNQRKLISSLIVCYILITTQFSSASDLMSNEKKMQHSPNGATDGQFIDRLLTFSPGTTYYSYNFTFEKKHRYDFSLKIYIPNTRLTVKCVLTGPDGDGDTYNDVFNLAQGILTENGTPSGSFSFGASMSGEYILTITGNTTKNLNVHFSAKDGGKCNSGPAIVYDVAGYYDNKVREYIFDLDDDKQYTIKFARTNSLDTDGTYAYADINLIRMGPGILVNNTFEIVEYIPLTKVFIENSESFGTAHKDTYKLEVTVYTNAETVNFLIVLVENSAIGDGPEDNPVIQNENSTQSDINFTSDFKFFIQDWAFYVFLGGGVALTGSIFYITFKKRKSEKFNSDGIS